MNPWRPRYRDQLASTLEQKGAWGEVLEQSGEWLRLDPSNLEGRIMHIRALLKTGNKVQARVEFAQLRALKPTTLEQLENWFAREIRE
jgi:Flp pilus assembly protein TadD